MMIDFKNMDIFRMFDSSRTYWSQTTFYYLIHLLGDFKETTPKNWTYSFW